jgi:hypothetical protein
MVEALDLQSEALEDLILQMLLRHDCLSECNRDRTADVRAATGMKRLAPPLETCDASIRNV